MVGEMSEESDSRVPVEILAEEYLQRRQDGDAVSIEDYAARYPDMAVDIREVFSALEALTSLATDWKRGVTDLERQGPELPFQLGDYLLEREIGRGGMGIVYKAQHTNLQRQVAVKLLKTTSLTTAKEFQRFHHEARAAARLHHTNIVPVFDFGEANGFHFIAMQLIDGTAVDRLVDELKRTSKGDAKRSHALAKLPEYGSTAYWNHVASMGVQAANALQYAHAQSTIHRDVKPANLLLDEAGVVWVADFGLARQKVDDDVSQAGLLSGTLRYLAPEQFHGEYDERTDQYGLGLSLYELATLKSATGSSGSHAEIIRQITEARIIPPRQVNPDIPRDLETIIQKAIAPVASNRYAHCQGFGDDLQRFATGQPVLARPVSSMERLWRWSKRNKALAASMAMSAGLLILVAVIATMGYRAEKKQRRRAEATSEFALQALDTVFDRYALSQPSAELQTGTALPPLVLSGDSARLLENLLPTFDRLAELSGESASVHKRATEARKRVGDIHQRLGNFEKAVQAYSQALTAYGTLHAAGSADYSLNIAAIHNEIGTCRLMLGQDALAKGSHLTALSQLQSQGMESHSEVTFQLARTQFLLTRRLRPGESPASIDNFAPGGDRRNVRLRPHGPPPELGGRGENSQANTEYLESAIDLLTSPGGAIKDEPRCRHLLAACLRGLCGDHFSKRRPAEIEAESQALEILEGLVEEFPEVPEYRRSLVQVLAGIDTQGNNSIHDDDLLAVDLRLAQALKVAQKLTAQHPYVPDYTVTLIHTHNKLANVLERRAEIEPLPDRQPFLNDARKSYQAAAKLQLELIQRFPESASYKAWFEQFQRSAERLRD